MKPRRFITGMIGMTLMLAGTTVRACLVCETSTGQRVRAGIWDGHFWDNVLLTALPFAIFAVIIGLLRFGVPFTRWAKHAATVDTHFGNHTTDLWEPLAGTEKTSSV